MRLQPELQPTMNLRLSNHTEADNSKSYILVKRFQTQSSITIVRVKTHSLFNSENLVCSSQRKPIYDDRFLNIQIYTLTLLTSRSWLLKCDYRVLLGVVNVVQQLVERDLFVLLRFFYDIVRNGRLVLEGLLITILFLRH